MSGDAHGERSTSEPDVGAWPEATADVRPVARGDVGDRPGVAVFGRADGALPPRLASGCSGGAKAMARLSHANVVQVYESGETGGEIYVAMEFLEGGTLRNWLTERHVLPESSACSRRSRMGSTRYARFS